MICNPIIPNPRLGAMRFSWRRFVTSPRARSLPRRTAVLSPADDGLSTSAEKVSGAERERERERRKI